jgi:hypothetical protein
MGVSVSTPSPPPYSYSESINSDTVLNNSSVLLDTKRREISDLCQHCRRRPSTTKWVGNGGALDLVHGFYQLWCDFCATTAQLEYAREAAARVPELEAKLATLK